MSYLKERILKDGVIFPNSVLKIDSFLNQQIDPKVMEEIGREFYDHFKAEGVTKILTIEASGIAPAIILASHLGVPMLFAKKAKGAPLKGDEVYETKVHSYTKGTTSRVCVSKQYLKEKDRVLIIDDFLANGEASLGLVDLVYQAGGQVVGVGICVEKSFQPGRRRLEEAGIAVYSLVRIKEINSDSQEILFEKGH